MRSSTFLTSKEQRALQTAPRKVFEVSLQGQRRWSRLQAGADNAGADQPTQPSANADMLARIAKAKAYKQQSSSEQTSTPSTTAGIPLQQPASVQAGSANSRVDYFSTTATASQTSEQAEEIPDLVKAVTGGTAEQPAYWLKGVMSDEAMQQTAGMDQNMRAEEFTQMKEQRLRESEVEIISVDKNYKPKVSTWGVFPRPQNISEAFGGGRTIKPGEQLESEEEQKEREKKTAEMLKEYKKSIGVLLEPEVQKQCDTLMEEAEALFKQGLLNGAYTKYDEILQLVPPRTRMGGLAGLQRAIILDSFGYSDKAQALYKSLVIHPTPEVAKKAKRMLFGFDAAKFLKTDTMDFSGKKQAWAKYFTQNSQVLYVQSEEEKARDAEASRQAALIAVAVMLGPVVVFGALSLSK